MSSRSSTFTIVCESCRVTFFTRTYSFVSELYPPSSALPPFPHTSPTSTPTSTAYIQIKAVNYKPRPKVTTAPFLATFSRAKLVHDR